MLNRYRLAQQLDLGTLAEWARAEAPLPPACS
jgi:hypothetical protein